MSELILLTGGSGKIGGRALKILLDQGQRVRALVHSTPLAIEHENLETVKGDLMDAKSLAAATQGVTKIAHIAAAFDLFPPTKYEGSDEFQWTANLEGTFHLAQAARNIDNLDVLLFASTDATYATGARKFDGIITEDIELEAGRFYGLMKIMGEVLFEQYRKLYGMPYIITRFCWTPDENDALKVYEWETWEGDMAAQDRERLEPLCAGGKDLCGPIYADGSTCIDHIADADDVAMGVVQALNEPKAIGGTYNLAGPAPFEHNEVIKIAAEATGKPCHQGVVEGVYPYEISIRKAKETFGYDPQFTAADLMKKAAAKLKSG